MGSKPMLTSRKNGPTPMSGFGPKGKSRPSQVKYGMHLYIRAGSSEYSNSVVTRPTARRPRRWSHKPTHLFGPSNRDLDRLGNQRHLATMVALALPATIWKIHTIRFSYFKQALARKCGAGFT